MNFQSRVQMYLFKAKKVAEAEFEKALEDNGLTAEQFRSFVKNHPRFGNALHRAPISGGSTPVDLIHEVAEYINFSSSERLVRRAKKTASDATGWLKSAITGAPTNAQKTAALGREFAVELSEIAREHGPDLARKTAKKGIEQARATVTKLPLPPGVRNLIGLGNQDEEPKSERRPTSQATDTFERVG